MADRSQDKNLEQQLRALEKRVDELVRVAERMQAENRALRSQQDGLVSERARLMEKTDLARTRVEAMMSRLRGMEHS